MQTCPAAALHRWLACPPWPLYLFGSYLHGFLKWLSSFVLPPPIRVLDLSMGFMRSHVIHAVAALSIADMLSEGPTSLTQLAARSGEPLWACIMADTC